MILQTKPICGEGKVGKSLGLQSISAALAIIALAMAVSLVIVVLEYCYFKGK